MSVYHLFEEEVRSGRLVAVATVLSNAGIGCKLVLFPSGASAGSLGDPALDHEIRTRGLQLLASLQSARLTVETAAGPVDVFVDVQPPQPRLLIVGAVHIAVTLVTYAKMLGFRTIVVDPRSAFATPARFSHADELIVRWPQEVFAEAGLDEAACIVALTHDEKIDNPALAAALRSPARYIGALGSRKTHARRLAALKELGLDDGQLSRIHAPIGLDIGARRPEEVALAIMAEIVAVMNGKGAADASPSPLALP